MTNRKGIPAKKAGTKKPKGKAKKKAATKKVVVQKPRAVGKSDVLATTAGPAQPPDLTINSSLSFSDQAEAEILPHARLRRAARDLAATCRTSTFFIDDHDGRVLAYGKPADLVRMLSKRVPKRRYIRDAVTGLFVSARAALRRPKTTTRETR